MMSVTHAAIACSGSAILLGSSSPWTLLLSVIGSQLPDIDTTKSISGKTLYPIAAWFEARFPHRTITHCLLATLFLTIASLPILYYYDWKHWLALPFGHLISSCSDTFTKEGVGLFYPSPVRCVCGSNPRTRLRTGSNAEFFVLGLAIAISVVVINIQSAGGLMLQVNQLLQLREGIEQIYNQSGSTNNIYIELTGVKSSDRSSADGKYYLIAQQGREFILGDREGIYKTNQNLIPKRMKAIVGESASNQTQTLAFDDDDVTSQLVNLLNTHKGSLILLSGQVAVDEPEEIYIPPENESLATIKLSGQTITMEYCPIGVAIAHLKDQYAIGSITARITRPVPVLSNE